MVNETDYMEVINEAKKLMIERNEKYGNSIDIIKWQSTIDLVLMKLIRTRELDPKDIKIDDEIIDSINYLVFAKLKLDKKMKEGY
jgi:hypothetical protein